MPMQPTNAAFPEDPEPTPEPLLTHPRWQAILQRLVTPLHIAMVLLLAFGVWLTVTTWLRKLDTWSPTILARAFFIDLAQMFIPLACSYLLLRQGYKLFGWAAVLQFFLGAWFHAPALGMMYPSHFFEVAEFLLSLPMLTTYALGALRLQPRYPPRPLLRIAFLFILVLWCRSEILVFFDVDRWKNWPWLLLPLLHDACWAVLVSISLGCTEAALRGEAPFARALWGTGWLFLGLTGGGLQLVDPNMQGQDDWLSVILLSSQIAITFSLIFGALTCDLLGKRLGIKTLLVVLVGLEASLGLPLLYDSPAHWVWLVYLVLMPASFGFFAYVYFTAYKATGDLEIQARLREEQARLDFDAQTIQELEARRAALEEENMALEQQAMKLRSATETKSQFLANMAHELRTPLNGILGFADVLANTMAEELSAEEREWAQEVLQEGEKLLGLINAVLDLAKCEAGAMVMRPQEVDLEALLREIGAGPLLAGRLQVHVTGEQPVLVWADAGRIRQALEMILGYYARYAKGYIPLDVNSTSGMVNLEIALALAVTVEPFYPGPDGKAPEGAAALALALGKALIEGHGGRMRVLYGRLRCRMVGVGVQEQDDVHRRLA